MTKKSPLKKLKEKHDISLLNLVVFAVEINQTLSVVWSNHKTDLFCEHWFCKALGDTKDVILPIQQIREEYYVSF